MNKITLVLIALLMFGACSPISNKQDTSTVLKEIPRPKPSLIDFADGFIHDQILQSPLNASFTYGDLEAQGLGALMYELDDATLESSLASIKRLKATQSDLFTYNYDVLTDQEKSIYELLDYQLDVAIRGEAYLLYANNFNPSFGLHVIMPLTLSQIELETPNEVEAYISRIQEMPKILSQAIEVEKLKAEASLLLPADLYETTIEQMLEMIAGEPENFMLYLSFVARIESVDFLSEDQKVYYIDQCLSIVKEQLFPAYENMVKELTSIKGSDTNALGTREWTNHKAYYEWLIYKYTSYELSTGELKAWLTTELDAVQRELSDMINRYPDLFDELSVVSEFNYATIEEAYEASEAIYEEHFDDYGVELAEEAVIPEYLVEHLPGGFYFPTSIDWQDYGTMYLPEESYSNLDIETFTTLLHENVPGHHMYYSILYNSDVPFVQKMSDWDPYSEGWAVYVQQYAFEALDMEEETIHYLETYFKYAYLNEMLRDMRLHMEGATKEEIVGELMAQGTSYENAEKNFNRMLANPGEVFQYYYAFMKIEAYKTLFEEHYKENFDEKVFHAFMLKHINMPFTSMDRLIKETLVVN